MLSHSDTIVPSMIMRKLHFSRMSKIFIKPCISLRINSINRAKIKRNIFTQILLLCTNPFIIYKTLSLTMGIFYFRKNNSLQLLHHGFFPSRSSCLTLHALTLCTLPHLSHWILTILLQVGQILLLYLLYISHASHLFTSYALLHFKQKNRTCTGSSCNLKLALLQSLHK